MQFTIKKKKKSVNMLIKKNINFMQLLITLYNDYM